MTSSGDCKPSRTFLKTCPAWAIKVKWTNLIDNLWHWSSWPRSQTIPRGLSSTLGLCFYWWPWSGAQKCEVESYRERVNLLTGYRWPNRTLELKEKSFPSGTLAEEHNELTPFRDASTCLRESTKYIYHKLVCWDISAS